MHLSLRSRAPCVGNAPLELDETQYARDFAADNPADRLDFRDCYRVLLDRISIHMLL